VLQRRENGTWQASGESCPWARVIAFGWQDLAIVHGGPSARRAFIDGCAARLYPSHLPALLRYRRLLEQRTRMLQTRASAERLARPAATARAGLAPGRRPAGDGGGGHGAGAVARRRAVRARFGGTRQRGARDPGRRAGISDLARAARGERGCALGR